MLIWLSNQDLLIKYNGLSLTIMGKKFDTVKTFRTIKEKISLEMASMNFEQIKAYLKENSNKLRKTISE